MKINTLYRPIYLYLLALTALVVSCDDFFEENIQEQGVQVISPIDGFSSPLQSITFWWESLAGATSYNIQVVSKSFNNVHKVWADTIVDGTQLILVLSPGEYQWRIRGFNSAYSTSYQTFSFSIEYNTNLENQEMVLKTPEDNIFTNSNSILFSWFELAAAEKYIFSIRDSEGNALVAPIETEECELLFPDDFDLGDLPDGLYTWSVQAKNWFSETTVASRSFTLDRISPSMPVLLLPANEDTLSMGNVTFSWEQQSESIAPLYDSLFVQSSDGNVSIKLRVNSLVETIELEDGEYEWRVQSYDFAGNSSQSSATRNFWIETISK